MRHRLVFVGLAVSALTACAPVLPQRTKMGGAARWAQNLAQRPAVIWAADARLCRVVGVGVGSDGWLPDRGGNWILTFWSPQKDDVLEVTVDSDGRVTKKTLSDSPHRGLALPTDWKDSPSVWAATRGHLEGEPISTFESELCHNAAPEAFPDEVVWRIRFYLAPSGFETHIVSPQGVWLQRL